MSEPAASIGSTGLTGQTDEAPRIEDVSFVWVDTDHALLDACAELSRHPVCAIDTEFLWERTYDPRLGLIQLAAAEHCYLIDPLSLPDLSPLVELLMNPSVLKVFHAAGMDLKILSTITGEVIAPVFDTQIAAALLGMGNQTSYLHLVEQTFGITLDKSETYTDWLQRPLTQKQIYYAARDATYLLGVHVNLHSRLEAAGRSSWAEEEFAEAARAYCTTPIDDAESYRGVKKSGSLDRRGLALLRLLAAWREAEARRRDVRPSAVIRDEPLVEIARRAPRDLPALASMRGIDERVVKRYGQSITANVKSGLEVPDGDLPIPPDRIRVSIDTQACVDLLWAAVVATAEQVRISAESLAGRTELRRLVDEFPGMNASTYKSLSGWRSEVIGARLLSLLRGDSSVSMRGGKVRIEDRGTQKNPV